MSKMVLVAVLCAPFLGACHRTLSIGDNNPTASNQWVTVLGARQKVDLLFMIDNSPSMIPKQKELQAGFPALLSQMQALASSGAPADYHIGVVTSDLGAGQFNLGGGQCHPGGDGGMLQAIGAAAAAGCQAPLGARFIDYDQLHADASGQPTSNLPPGQDLSTTFDCMASVGAAGCGFESQLESVYTALHDPIVENQGFLRPDALLMVVFVSDEDDCSAPPDTDLFDPAHTEYGAELSYRCTQYGIVCGDPPALMPYGDSNGTLANCRAAPNPDGMGPGKLFDIGRYTDFFTKPAAEGGIKNDPGDVVLVDLTAPDSPVESLLANPSETPPGPYQQCSALTVTNSCAVVLQHSCIAPSAPELFGDPAVRIRQVVNSARQNLSASICDPSYDSAMKGMGNLLASRVPGGCVTDLADPAHPQCEVSDVTANADGTTTKTALPACGSGVAEPCWHLVSDASCPTRLIVDRSTQIAPNTEVQARCLLGPAT